MSTPYFKNSHYHYRSREAENFSNNQLKLKPKKRLGQVFLKNNNFLSKIIKSGEISSKDTVLEIGAGKGVLTEALLETGAKVIAIEKDSQLVEFLKERFKNKPNLQIIQGDIRDILNQNFTKNLDSKFQILNSNYKVAGNIPYYLTSYLIRLLLTLEHKPQIIILMVQKEVAQRIISQPPQMNLLATITQFYAQVELISLVPKSAFYPQPKVDSALIKLIPYQTALISNKEKQAFFLKLVKAGFSQPRKLLINNLNNQLLIDKDIITNAFEKLHLSLNLRAQNLSLKDWLNLTDVLFGFNSKK